MTDDAAEPAGPASPAGSGERIMRIADLVNLELETRVQLLQEMTPRECAQLFHDWTFWARDDQAPPPETGSSGSSSPGAAPARRGRAPRRCATGSTTYPIVNLIGATLADARDIMVRGESGILACCRRDERPEFHATDLRLEWPNGAVSQLFSAEEPDRLRGKQHMKLWCDELAAWRAARRLRSGDAGVEARRQAAGGRHHDAAPEQDHQRRWPRERTRSSRAARPSTIRRIWRGRSSSASRRAIKGAPSASRSCSPKSSRRRRGRCGRGRCSSANALRRKLRRRNSPRSWSRSIRRRARARNPTNAGSWWRRKRKTASSTCSPT